MTTIEELLRLMDESRDMFERCREAVLSEMGSEGEIGERLGLEIALGLGWAR
jgi:hypothetical protein